MLLHRWGDEERHAGSTGSLLETAHPGASSEIRSAIGELPELLQATLREVYVMQDTAAGHALRLRCPEATVARRVGRAHLLLANRLADRRDEQLDEEQRRVFSQRLAER